MTVVWAWVDLGDHSLQKYNIKQYWLILSVLSVKKFHPDWKRTFVTDSNIKKFIYYKGWNQLFDDIIEIDFKNTSYGNLYNIQLYSFPKIYSYGLIDDDIIAMDIDVVLVDKLNIKDCNKMGGKFYNHIDDFYINIPTNITNLSYKWNDIENAQNTIKHVEGYNKLNQTDICLVGSPIYCPKHLTKLVQNVIKYIFEIESIYDGILPNETFYELEEEWPITKIGLDNGGIWNIEQSSYIHGYMSYERRNIDKGIKEAECILGEDVFNKYIK